MLLNAINPYQNLSLTSYLFKSDGVNSENKEMKLDLQEQNLNPLDYISKNSYASEFGFRIDEKGFFDKDLNKSAYLPESYSLNIKSIRSIVKELIKQDENLTASKVDLPYILNSYYNVLKSINSEFKEGNNTYLNRDYISNLKQGFSTENGDFLGSINRIYENQNDLNENLYQNTFLNTHMLDNKIFSFHFDKSINNTSSNEVIKPYLSNTGAVTKSGLLLNFVYQDIKNKNEEDFNFFMKPVSLDLKAHQNFYNILNGKQDVEDFIRQNNQEKMSFDLYLYVNGVDKKNVSRDKLSVFFQQYVNYEKSMNLKEFANSSSIFKIYLDEVKQDFTQWQKDYKRQSDDLELLDSINRERNYSDKMFLEQRYKQAGINKIIKSYFSVMI